MEYDVIVIGAGIHGAGVAQAASAAGYRTLVIEQYDQPALGTSSRSSKLIHGGLRYLETAQFGLVWECLRERRILLNSAPHLVKLVPFYIPVYKGTHRPPWLIMIGLMLYALLGGKGFSRISRSKWGQLDGLRSDGLKAVFQYWDAQTDDQMLTESVLESAVELGAEVELGCTFKQAITESGSCIIEYEREGEIKTVESRVVVNASGPWINSTLGKIKPAPRQLAIDLVQGSHILVSAEQEKGVYYLEAPQDQRAVLVMPWNGGVLIGTTEKRFEGDPADVSPTTEEINYLLEVYNHYFSHKLNRADIRASFAGIRVLKREGESIFHRSRETILHRDKKNSPMVLSIYGGKLSSYRATGEKVVNKIAKMLPKRRVIADTKRLKLP